MKNHHRLLFVALLLIGSRAHVGAQAPFETLGPNECLNCHDHETERQWYEKKEIPEVQRLFPDRNATAGHVNSLKQLETPKSKEFADAIGLKDKYDVGGPCVGCHATVFAGDANAGVSCESCHGPASGYLKPHQTKDAYETSVAQYGMTKLVGNIQGWTQQCSNCHVMNDERLIKAGHPSGDDFDLGKKFQPVSIHFKKKYDAAEVTAIAASEMAGIIRRRRPASAIDIPAPAATRQAVPSSSTPETQPSQAAASAGTSPDAAGKPGLAAAQGSPARTPGAVRQVTSPPPGSPTSIEPPPPIADAGLPTRVSSDIPPTVAVPPPISAVSIPVPAPKTIGVPWIVAGALVIVGSGALLLMRRRK